MDEHINSMSDAYQKYLESMNAVLAEYRSAGGGGLRTDVTNLALEKFRELHEHFQLTCDNAEGFVDTMTQHVRELEVAHHINAVDPNAAPVPVKPSYAQLLERLSLLIDAEGELDSDARHGDGADVADELDTAASTQAVANPEVDPNKVPTEAAVSMMMQQLRAAAGLPDVDPHKTA